VARENTKPEYNDGYWKRLKQCKSSVIRNKRGA
jgi:hypothetical protein